MKYKCNATYQRASLGNRRAPMLSIIALSWISVDWPLYRLARGPIFGLRALVFCSFCTLLYADFSLSNYMVPLRAAITGCLGQVRDFSLKSMKRLEAPMTTDTPVDDIEQPTHLTIQSRYISMTGSA